LVAISEARRTGLPGHVALGGINEVNFMKYQFRDNRGIDDPAMVARPTVSGVRHSSLITHLKTNGRPRMDLHDRHPLSRCGVIA
jgi:hypothetical protein